MCTKKKNGAANKLSANFSLHKIHSENLNKFYKLRNIIHMQFTGVGTQWKEKCMRNWEICVCVCFWNTIIVDGVKNYYCCKLQVVIIAGRTDTIAFD